MFESLLAIIGIMFHQATVATSVSVPISVPTTSQYVEPLVTSNIKGENSPLSLVSFFDKKFVGTDFNVTQLRNDWGSHRSYNADFMSNGLKVSGTWHVPTGDGPFPVIILNHGYIPHNQYFSGFSFALEQKFLARNGYAVFHNDYRGYARSDIDPDTFSTHRLGYTGYATDTINAVLAIKAAKFTNIDTSRVGVFGHSMGGGVTLNAALARPDLFTALIISGSVSTNYYHPFQKWMLHRTPAKNIEQFETIFGSIKDPNSFRAVSTKTYLDRLQTPLLIQQGSADKDCPIEWSNATSQILTLLNKDFEYKTYEGYPHLFHLKNWTIPAKDMLDYFDLHLKK